MIEILNIENFNDRAERHDFWPRLVILFPFLSSLLEKSE